MREYLEPGYKLYNTENNAAYTICNVMGEGASCIAYEATRDSYQGKYVIKEYYPLTLALSRNPKGCLDGKQIEMDKLTDGISRIREKVEFQERLGADYGTGNQTFRVIDKFSSNNTYYYVVEKFNGETYKEKVSALSLYERVRFCKSVARYVEKCHEAGFLCLDIKPTNVFVIPETTEFAMFFDFDSFRKVSDLRFGGTSSYTEEWAAPEQVVPGLYNRISFATDVYILGELLFWSVFERHSKDSEHRRFSPFSFETSPMADQISVETEDILKEIFHNSIRSSAENRFNSVNEMLDKIKALEDAVRPLKESIVKNIPSPTDFFIGRENELSAIKETLNEKHKIFLQGIGGIGKSEIVKNYINKYSKDYNATVYLVFAHDFVTMINDTQFLSDCDQTEHETSIHFCKRKLDVLYKLFSKNKKNLLVIDNLDVVLEDLENDSVDRGVWERICSLPCDLIVTTRKQQDCYSSIQLNIGTLGLKNLELLFAQNCRFEEKEREAVDAIISEVSGHTLGVELIAKHASVGEFTPSEILAILRQKGVLGLNSEPVKTGMQRATVEAFVRRLFSVAELTAEEKNLLYTMALMPQEGVLERVFKDFYGDCSFDMRHLIDNGWINVAPGNSHILSMHSMIASVALDEIGKEKELLHPLYNAYRGTLNRWDYYDSINWEQYCRIYKCITLYIMKCISPVAEMADYLVVYANRTADLQGADDRGLFIKKAIQIYNSVYELDDYVAVRERAYESYVHCLIDGNHYEEAGVIISEHLPKAEHHKDLFMGYLWAYQQIFASLGKNGYLAPKEYVYIRRIRNNIDVLLQEEKKNESLISIKYLEELHYGYMIEWRDIFVIILLDYYFSLSEFLSACIPPKYSIQYYKMLISNREKIELKDRPSIIKTIFQSKVESLQENFDEAINLLDGVIYSYDTFRLPYDANILRVREEKAKILILKKQYDTAINELEICLDIAASVGRRVFDVRAELVRVYILCGRLNNAAAVNGKQYDDLKNIDENLHGLLFAKTDYNEANILLMSGDLEGAKKMLEQARNHLKGGSVNKVSREWIIVFARIQYQHGVMNYRDNDLDKAKSFLTTAYICFKIWLGGDHPESIECKALLDKCRADRKHRHHVSLRK